MTRIGIDHIGAVDRRIFGQFIEPLGRCIDGGIYERRPRAWNAARSRAIAAKGSTDE